MFIKVACSLLTSLLPFLSFCLLLTPFLSFVVLYALTNFLGHMNKPRGKPFTSAFFLDKTCSSSYCKAKASLSFYSAFLSDTFPVILSFYEYVCCEVDILFHLKRPWIISRMLRKLIQKLFIENSNVFLVKSIQIFYDFLYIEINFYLNLL